ncbi:serine/threonine protein kinase, partial [bacterium]
RVIGAGGMASVWSATNVFTERQFAIKFMAPQLARTREAATRFLLEAKVSARIDHPNIIEVIDVGQAEDGSLFLVMELLTGVSLETALKRPVEPMRLHDFVAMMLDVARALAAAHKSGVVHRDLKPTNIFLHQPREGVSLAKVLDFGVSKVIEDEGVHGLTMAGTVLGSPLYMSPEQAAGSTNIDGRTDIFAFGAIVFEALAGFRCFDAPNFNALIVTIATTPPRAIDEAAPEMPAALRALVRECLVTNRERRIGSFDLVVARLEAMLPELASSSRRLPIPKVVGPPSVPSGETRTARRISAFPPSGPISLQPTPPSGVGAGVTGPGANGGAGAGAYSARWDAAATATGASSPGERRMWLIAVAGFTVTALVLVGTLAAVTRKRARASEASAQVDAPRAPTSATPARGHDARAYAEPDTMDRALAEPDAGAAIDVDSLPLAAPQHARVTARGPGQLVVSATPGG